MRSFFAVNKKLLVATTFCLSITATAIPHAEAANPTLDVIGPHEYALPVNYESFNVFVQYAYYQTDNRAYDNSGNSVTGPHTTTAVGLTKYVRFFSLKDVPNVGFAYEIIVPEISVQKPGVSVTGIGDPITGPAFWFKPTKNSTLGIQSFLQIPAGTESVSDGSWKNLTSVLYDVQLGALNIVGDTGFVYQSKVHKNGAPDVDPGTTFHQNLRVGYRVLKHVEPFLGYDFAVTGSAKDASGATIPNSVVREHTVGAGLMFAFSDNISLTTRYSYGVDGANTNRTNSLNVKFAYVW